MRYLTIANIDRQCCRGNDPLEQCFDLGFIEACEFFLTFDDDRTLQQVGIFEHEFDGFVFGRRFLLHFPFPIKRSSRVEKGFDRVITDDVP